MQQFFQKIKKLYCFSWNIGIIEQNIKHILLSNDVQFQVHWVKHKFNDRFFADPFILSVDEKVIKVLVEDFPFYDKHGMISLLTIDRQSYKLLKKKVILKHKFHMSYPFIQRNKDGSIWVIPESSMSGKLYRYTINQNTNMLENQKELIAEPLIDSTILEHESKFWLFCTKRGGDSNKNLYIYYADTPDGPYKEHESNPVVADFTMARPAGCFFKEGSKIIRVIQKCDKTYGEAINVSCVNTLTTNEFKETFIKEIRAQKDEYSKAFHTINGYGNICVVDGMRSYFNPFRRIWFELRNKFKI